MPINGASTAWHRIFLLALAATARDDEVRLEHLK